MNKSVRQECRGQREYELTVKKPFTSQPQHQSMRNQTNRDK